MRNSEKIRKQIRTKQKTYFDQNKIAGTFQRTQSEHGQCRSEHATEFAQTILANATMLTSGQVYEAQVLIWVQQWLWSMEMLHEVVAQRSVLAVGT